MDLEKLAFFMIVQEGEISSQKKAGATMTPALFIKCNILVFSNN